MKKEYIPPPHHSLPPLLLFPSRELVIRFINTKEEKNDITTSQRNMSSPNSSKSHSIPVKTPESFPSYRRAWRIPDLWLSFVRYFLEILISNPPFCLGPDLARHSGGAPFWRSRRWECCSGVRAVVETWNSAEMPWLYSVNRDNCWSILNKDIKVFIFPSSLSQTQLRGQNRQRVVCSVLALCQYGRHVLSKFNVSRGLGGIYPAELPFLQFVV